MGIVAKEVKGKRYLYFTYWKDGRLVEEYIGNAGELINQVEAIQRRLHWLRLKREEYDVKINVLESELKCLMVKL